MNWLNYHHLRYFWTVVKEGGINRASRALNLTQPTISKQLKLLEEQIGEPLFERHSRKLQLTECGRLAFDYAEEIFPLGQEFLENLKGVGGSKPRRLRVGASDLLPKLVVHRILAPVLTTQQNVHLICDEDTTERLLADLSIQQLDLVLADAPISGAARVKAFNHLLGQSDVSFFATPALAKSLQGRFPRNLDHCQFLAPSSDTLIRRSLEQWFTQHKITPRVIAEFRDSALMKVFGREGFGVFPGPSVIADEICREYGVKVVGQTRDIKESFYAITVERKVKHPSVVLITENARQNLFASTNNPAKSSSQKAK
jgi:LysR family transcriptional activator of nhaA